MDTEGRGDLGILINCGWIQIRYRAQGKNAVMGPGATSDLTYPFGLLRSARMILSDTAILEAIEAGHIVIDPYDREALGTNSYDVHLGKTLATYEKEILDARQHNTVQRFDIPPEGHILIPHRTYLGVTQEYTESHVHVPFLEGKSSVGRLGIDIHATAGKGDVGFCNHWTLEISVHQPVRVYAGMPIAQLIYFKVEGAVGTPYATKKNAKYTERTPYPVESMMWKNQW